MFALLMIGAGILVPAVERARLLEFSWAHLLWVIPFISLLGYVGFGLFLRRSIGAIGWVASFVGALLLYFIPTVIVSANTRSLSVNHFLQPSEMAALKAKFPHPFFHYSSSSDGIRLVVKKSDCTEALLEYLQTNHVAVAN